MERQVNIFPDAPFVPRLCAAHAAPGNHAMKKLLLLSLLLGSSLAISPTSAAEKNSPNANIKPVEDTSLKGRAVKAFKEGNNKLATELAVQLLKEKAPENIPLEKRDGDAIHDANQILGLVALREKRVKDAKLFLIAAGSTPGSPNLELFGPNMKLAQELLIMGEKGIVIAYLNMVSKFWGNVPPAHRKELEKSNPILLNNIDYMNEESIEYLKKWIALIRKGETPMLNHSAAY
jgi:hypothetical protein